VSIKLKLIILFLMFALIPMFFIGALTFRNYENSLKAGHITTLRDIAFFKADKIEARLASLKASMAVAQGFYNIKRNLPVLTRLANKTDDPEFRAAWKMLDSQLSVMQTALELVDIMLVDPEGKIVYSRSLGNPSEYLNILPDPGQKSFTEGKNGTYITDIFFNKAQGNKLSILIAAPVVDFNDVFIGVIVFEMNIDQFYNLIQDVTGLGKTGETLLGKKIGNEVLYLNPLRHDPVSSFYRRITIGSKIGVPIQEAVQGKTGAGLSIDYRMQEVISAWRYIPSLGWGIVAKIDTREAFSDVGKLRKLVLMGLLYIFVLASITALLFSESIARPINKLVKGAQIVGGGNLDYKIASDRKDEIGQLSRAFDKMTFDLQKTIASRDDLNKEIDRAKRLSDIGTLAATVAHELRNPLADIGLSTYHIKKMIKDPRIEGDLSTIDKRILEADQIINNVLLYSRIKIGRFQTVKINSILKECIDGAMGKSSGQNITVNVKIDHTKDLFIDVDSLQMKGVFSNILNNAVDALNKNFGIIDIESQLKDSVVSISIKDNGEGIEKEHLKKVFEPFFTTKTKGTGLGLAVCDLVIKLHKGSITIESDKGKGAMVTIILPIHRQKNA